MLIFKIIGIGICGAVLGITVRQYRPELAVGITVLTAVAVVYACLPSLVAVLEVFETIADETGLDTRYVNVVVKIIATAYICKFASDLCADAGETSIASKIELGGKVAIVAMSMPIIYGLLELTARIIGL